jgi:hypothetical protein
MLSKDGWAGLVVAATSFFLFAFTLGLKGNPLVPIGPGFYPRIVLALTALLGFWLIVEDFLGWRRRLAAGGPSVPGGAQAGGERSDYAAVAIQFAVFGIYVAALPYLGFRISTVLYVAAANSLMAPPRGLPGWGRAGAIALGTTAVTYFAFERYLTVLLPRGRWTDF